MITDILNMLRVNSTVYIGKNLTAPWGVHITEHESLARFHIVVSGSTWVQHKLDDEPVLLRKGDIAIFFNGVSHSYMDAPGRQTKMASFPSGDENSYFSAYDTKTDDTHLLCGYFSMSSATPPAISDNLPDMLIGRVSDVSLNKQFATIVELIRQELANFSEHSRVVLDRMTEILCVYTLQSWVNNTLGRDEHLIALTDPKTKCVLDMIHQQPDKDWTVDTLARIYGQSRTAFTSHFKQKTGFSPMHYVRRWRIMQACQMLEGRNLSIDEVAFKSGYADTNAFNRAFKRETGYSPGAYKRRIGSEAVPSQV